MTLSYDSKSIHDPAPVTSSAKLSATESKRPLSLPLGRQVKAIRVPGTDCLIKPQVPLSSLTSFKVGGPAELYVAPRRFEDLQASCEWAEDHGSPVMLLGAGTNLLVSDRGLPGLVIGTRYLRHTQFDEETGQITAGAGEPIARLAWQAAERGWQGLEWAVGIPGTVGGAVVMNAGAHQSCIADILVNAHVFSVDGKVEILTPETLDYRYRSSNLQVTSGSNSPLAIRLVTQATFQLQPGANPKQVVADTTAHMTQRRVTQPYHLPSCGSVFRNPSPHSAGWLIEQSGLKGYQIGGAQVAQRHANFILNCGGATASDIFQLIRFVQQKVEQNWALTLEPEVKMLGDFQLAI
ncbi:UDP-N-acetylmuramate dehydrogenase [Oculatella sp. LEGE 06141]|uniref:UDP-N-acetylmuramate dehydrogenase n=1 Tax=Oculatella sp. LEGE 06141 TaxID=1828648 RepID=UPI00187F9B41|nr:UDP-N-acetylmuramate dehydrogenase [Oculatella sp. LEGE 06141]MBE9181306.1 UDP-N-acetylmuramate dehydrogenase [Oculatella sp. LEGE 06141]